MRRWNFDREIVVFGLFRRCAWVLIHCEFVVIERFVNVIFDASRCLRGPYERHSDRFAGDAGMDAKHDVGGRVNAVSESIEFDVFLGETPFGY
jgi:hypothetical protein